MKQKNNSTAKQHRNLQKMAQDLDQVQNKVKIGGTYHHYKDPNKHYKIINLGFIEKTDEVAVIYQTLYKPSLIFIRPLKSWLETVQIDQKKTPRFTLVK